jgi:hypothetical protein
MKYHAFEYGPKSTALLAHQRRLIRKCNEGREWLEQLIARVLTRQFQPGEEARFASLNEVAELDELKLKRLGRAAARAWRRGEERQPAEWDALVERLIAASAALSATYERLRDLCEG